MFNLKRQSYGLFSLRFSSAFLDERTAQNRWIYGLCPTSGILHNYKTRFGNWICFRLVKGQRYSAGSLSTGPVIKVNSSYGTHPKTEKKPASKTLFSSYLEFRMMGKVHKPSLSVIDIIPQTLALTSPTSGGRSVGIVRSQTQAMELLVVS
jgi:hypothetical protein